MSVLAMRFALIPMIGGVITALYIRAVGYCLQMIWVHALPVLAQMVDLMTSGHRPLECDECHLVAGVEWFFCSGIPVPINTPSPIPAAALVRGAS